MACGRCGARIPPGQAVQVITGETGWRLVRCQACAGPAPAVVEAGPLIEAIKKPRLSLPSTRELARDWKAQQAGW
jgi:hypothetical protein